MKDWGKIISRKMLGISVVVILITAVSLFGFRWITALEQERCLQELGISASASASEISLRLNDNISILRLAGIDIGTESHVSDITKTQQHLASFQSLTIFERIDLIYPDGSIIYQDGAKGMLSDETAFEELLSKGEHMSERMEDMRMPDKYVVCYHIPVFERGEAVAILVGVLRCDKMAEVFASTIYDGKADICIVDRRDGVFIMKSGIGVSEHVSDLESLEMGEEYKNDNVAGLIADGETGVVSFIPAEGESEEYLYFNPISSSDWEQLVVVEKDVIFQGLIRLQWLLLSVLGLETIILIVHFISSIWNSLKLLKTKSQVEQQLEVSNTLVKCISALSENENIDTAINRMLQIVSEFFDSDRAYVFEVDYEQNVVNNTYEYTKANVSKEIDILQNIPISLVEPWLEAFRKSGYVAIEDINNDMDNESDTYRVLAEQAITSLIVMPLFENDGISGFLGVDNPQKNYDNNSLIRSVTYFLMDSISKRKTRERLEHLSFEDALTGIYNRNKFNQDMEAYSSRRISSLGFAYFDINGLKATNDRYGHKTGDMLIRNTALCLVEVFGKNTYRIGGDEFVVIMPEISKADFNTMVDRAIEELEEKKVSISVGISWRGEMNDIMLQMHEADEKMYRSKQKYYAGKPDRRRRVD